MSQPLELLRPAAVIAVVLLAPGCNGPNNELASLRKTVNELAAPYLVTDADVRVKLDQSILTKVVRKIASLPSASRHITFQSNSRSGYVWSQGGGFLGCGGYAEINSLTLAADIVELQGQWRPDGRLALRLGLSAQASGSVHGHIKGPAGPCNVFKWSCDCPIGGGFGADKNVGAEKGAVFDGYASFAPAANGGVDYAVYLTSPRDMSVTISVETIKIDRFELPRLGVPVSFSLPSDPIGRGSGLALISSSGEVKIAGKERSYQVEVSELKIKTDTTGIDVRGKMLIKLSPRAAS